jgi:hypothetical protein
VQVGLRYAGQIVTIKVDETTLRVYDQHDHLIKTVPRSSRKDVHRHKAYGHTTNQKPASWLGPAKSVKLSQVWCSRAGSVGRSVDYARSTARRQRT